MWKDTVLVNVAGNDLSISYLVTSILSVLGCLVLFYLYANFKELR